MDRMPPAWISAALILGIVLFLCIDSIEVRASGTKVTPTVGKAQLEAIFMVQQQQRNGAIAIGKRMKKLERRVRKLENNCVKVGTLEKLGLMTMPEDGDGVVAGADYRLKDHR